MENQNQNPQPSISSTFFQSHTARMIMVGILTLFLLIPLELVNNLIHERELRQSDVMHEITDKWGKEVYFYGPILKVPYTVFFESEVVNEITKQVSKTRTAQTQYAYFFPEELKNNATVETKLLKRNNYEAVVFTTKMNFKGNYIQPDFSLKNIPTENVQWDKATILIQTENLKSIKEEVKIKFGTESLTFEPVYNSEENPRAEALETSFMNLTNYKGVKNIAFDFTIQYDGSSRINIVPIGKVTEAKMTSNWASPSFNGNFLPSDKNKTISANGFEANWKILHINRPFSQSSFGSLPNLQQYAFGVDFVIPIDEYQKNERASKYGFLVIGLTFLVFFLIQSVSKIKIHIFQYTMIGLALIMFYTLLISITEHSSFRTAYIVSALSVIILISLYSLSILKNRKFPTLIGISLTALYGFIYVIIQLENYALLVGSIGLFAILAAVMFISRKIDWNKN
ncbi:cell envelope integrity protein CreD [Flavobacterium sp. '19STA2R22 D10 B1']|uniref:cell envelope integrity protein CreD n=1 Tax=Flavobacterium aerium TaxID=3037261 RepID=UPI00278C0A5C|nr:cell envelope integrity protein CreD [Flavobacterium sp. '19STA2R22 D10 B1']